MPERTCPDCGERYVKGSHGLCGKCVLRRRRAGTELPDRLRPSFLELIELSRRGPNECWPWAGNIADNGYGRRGPRKRAHREVYIELIGPIPEDLTLDHLCHANDPSCAGGDTCLHRRCVNPRHLEPVPMVENNRRGLSPAAKNARKETCPRNHPLDWTYRVKGKVWRRCSICTKRQNAESAARQH